MNRIEEEIQRRLFELQDLKYKEFSVQTHADCNPETVIGVRTPDLRKLAKEYSKAPEAFGVPQIFCRTHIMKRTTCTAF